MPSMKYYVSNQNGSDFNPGTSPDTAKKTIQAGIGLLGVSAGDILYIGPGTYREALSLLNNGAIANRTKIIGDPNCLSLTSDRPGVVRVTATDTSNIVSLSGASNALMYVYTYANYEIENILFDGEGFALPRATQSSNYGTYGNLYGGRPIIFNNCSFQNISYCGARDVILNDCFVSGGRFGVFNCKSNNCVIFGGNYGTFSNSVTEGITQDRNSLTSCIVFGGQVCVGYASAYNCLAIGSTYGYFKSAPNNSISLFSYYGYYDSNLTSINIKNCFSSNCEYISRLSNTVGVTGFYDNVWSGVYELGITVLTGWTQAPLYRFDGWKVKEYIKKAFDPNPEQCGLSAMGDFSLLSFAGSYDILGRSRIMGTGTQIDIGPYALSNIEEKYENPYYYTSPPGLSFTNIGQKIFDIYAPIGTISVSAWMIDQAGDDMSMTLVGDNIITSSFDTDMSGTWQIGSVSASITGSDQKLKLIISNNAAGTTGWVSDIRVY